MSGKQFRLWSDAASDLDLHCLLRLIFTSIYGYYDLHIFRECSFFSVRFNCMCRISVVDMFLPFASYSGNTNWQENWKLKFQLSN